MTLHIISLPHTRVNADYNSCAYTAKIYKFKKMFPEAVLYGNEGSLALPPDPLKGEPLPAESFVQIFSNAHLEYHFGNMDWYQKKEWYKVSYDYNLKYWRQFNSLCITELKQRIEPHDLILLSAGYAQKQIADAFPNHIVVEMGVGYEGIFAKYRVFESYAWMHYLYGKYGVADGNFFDCVIPNFFDVEDFKPPGPLKGEPSRGEYLLFMGRPIERKGIEVVREIAKRHKVIAAGAEPLTGEGIEYVGYADTKLRAELMTNAKAVLVPTLYIAPFEGVNVEAQLCGTPVITTDFGAFAETVVDGVTGARCRSLRDSFHAIDNIDKLDRQEVKQWATDNYSLEAVKPQYQRYFSQLGTLWGKGWYDT